MTNKPADGWRPIDFALLLGLFLVALLPRLYSAQSVGWNWDSPGSFTLVNFDEAGSCRAALGGFDYSTFIGRQTIAIATMLGDAPDPAIVGKARQVKAYCHSPEHILVARSFSAVTGALTVVVLVIIALMLVPSQPGVAWTAGALLALSGFHISESHSGTVDVPSVFFIYTFIALMIFSVSRPSRAGLVISPLLLVPAVWAKYWVFAIFAYCSLGPLKLWRYLSHGFSTGRIVLLVLATSVLCGLLSNTGFQASGAWYLLAAWYLVIPWRKIHRPMYLLWLLLPLLLFLLLKIHTVDMYTSSTLGGRFGSGYGAIGWNKWLRNLVNLPAVLLVGLGIPASLFIPAGIRRLFASEVNVRAWLCLMPLLAFALFMAFLAPVTYYRHYLALLPVAALLAACGLFATRWAGRRWFMALFFLWPGMLALDLVNDYHNDPRIELRRWFEEHSEQRAFISYYVNPPARAPRSNRLFRPEYAFGDAAVLKEADYLILSENWYDTAFANELNGPVVSYPERLIKTTPEYANFYRKALAGRHSNLVLEESIDVSNYMPELLLHRWLYGTFQLFVGDIRIFRVVD